MSFLWKKLIRPLVFSVDAETAHKIGMRALRIGIAPGLAGNNAALESVAEAFGPIERFGLRFTNPLGVAAGFDKNGVAVKELSRLGFGFVEVGTVTYEPQKGNERPRLFRLPQDAALINRLGFNNEGAEAIVKRLTATKPQCIVGANIGKNKDVPNDRAIESYLKVFDRVHSVADYIAINVSSPNTPNLRELQKAENLEELLNALQERNGSLCSQSGTANRPLLVKIAPDLNESDIESVVDVCLRCQISGIIATNTTTSREGLKTGQIARFGDGGLSGAPLAGRSNEVIAAIYRFSNGKLPIVGVGGIFTPEDAFAKIAAGACLLQAYTGFVYEGPDFPVGIIAGLARILKAKGFGCLDETVGSAVDSRTARNK